MTDWIEEEEGRGALRPTDPLSILRDSFLAERARFFLWLPVLVGAGIAAYFALRFEPPGWAGIAAMGLLGFLALAGRRDGFLLWPCVALCLVASGFALAQWQNARVAAPVLERSFGPAELEGRVVVLERMAEGNRVTLDRVSLARLRPDQTPERVRIVLKRRDAAAPLPGQWIAVRARLNPPPAPAMPGGYDFQRRAWFDGLGAVGFALGEVRLLSDRPAGAYDRAAIWLAGLRDGLSQTIRTRVEGEAGAVSAALVTGDRSAIPETVLDDMRDSGLAHLLAISGLHVGLVAALLFAGLRAVLALLPPLALRYPIKKWAALAAILGAVVYMVLAGATVPTQRAVLMTAIALGAVMLDRYPFSPRLVAVAALVVMALQPEELMGPSFQLSFAAVVALIAFYEAFGRRLADFGRAGGWPGRIALYLVGVALTTLVAGAATGLIGAYHFNRVAQYSLIANMMAIPLTGFWIMPAAVLSVLAMPFGLEAWPLWLMGQGVTALLWVADTTAHWPGAVGSLPQMPDWGFAGAVLGGLWLCLWTGRKRLLGLAGIGLSVVSFLLTVPPDLLVNEDARLIGIRTGEGLYLSSLRREKYTAEMWAESLGEPPHIAFPKAGESAMGGDLRCDAAGCLWDRDGLLISLGGRAEALAGDCARADIVITGLRVARWCKPGLLAVTGETLARDGALFLRWSADGRLQVDSVRDRRGTRPWTGG